MITIFKEKMKKSELKLRKTMTFQSK